MIRFSLLVLLAAIVALSQGSEPADTSPALRSTGKVTSIRHRELKWDNNWYKTEEEKQQIQEEYEQQMQQEQDEYEQQLQEEQEEYEQYVQEKQEKAEEGQNNEENQEFYEYYGDEDGEMEVYDETGYGYSGVETGLTYESFGDGVDLQAQVASARSSQEKWMIATAALLAVGSLVAVGMYVFARRKAAKSAVEKNFSLMEEPKQVDIA